MANFKNSFLKKNNLIVWKLGVSLKPPSPSLNYNKHKLESLVRDGYVKGKNILDLGSGGRKFSCPTISMDIEKKRNIEVIADASALPFKAGIFDLIINTAVLEHVKYIEKTLSEIERCLALNGVIYCEVPFLQTYHAHPNDYRRFTLPGIEQLFEHYQKVESGVCVGAFSTIAWYMRKFPRYILGGGLIGYILDFIIGWLTFWIKYFDVLIPRSRKLYEIASGVYYMGRKQN